MLFRSGIEPHIWNSARNASAIARNIYAALSELDSANEPYYKHRLDSLQQIIAQTDTEVRDRLQNADTTFLIYHPALSYFARDYGLKQISIEERGKEPSPAHLKELIETAYINGATASSLAYRPQFVSNNHKEGKKVLSSVEDELLACDQFQISVAFITMSGITPLLQTLKELEKKNIPGEILTTNYLNFSEPRALKKLNELQNITLKMYDVEAAKEGFHTKGYIFKKEEIYRIIIGSSNITSAALTYNREWNTKIVSTEDGEMAREIVQEFDSLWNSKYALDFDTFYESYREKYKIIKHQRDVAKLDDITSIEKYKLEPNSMQVGFIKNLRKIQEAGERKALLISATGTGKTYASAFAMRELGYQRVLFLVHRNQIGRAHV